MLQQREGGPQSGAPTTEPTRAGRPVAAGEQRAGRVVVAVDGGWASRRALRQAALEAERRGTGVVVVTVVASPWSEHDCASGWRDADRDAVETAHAVCAAATEELRRVVPHLPVESVVAGRVEELGHVDTALLVLGRSGAGGRGVFRMGTTSGDLMTALGGPVLVCRDERLDRRPAGDPSGLPLRRGEVVAAVHVGAEVTTVLRRAHEEAALRGMSLCVFTHDADPGPQVVAALGAETQVPWRIVHTSGSEAAEAILRYTDSDDLLVLGRRGRSRLAGHVRGSVTRAVLDHMTCDVLLVPVPNAHPSEVSP